jgi:hypothetical protein
LCPEKKSGCRGVSEEDAERVRETFTRSPKKSLRQASREQTFRVSLQNDTYMMSV